LRAPGEFVAALNSVTEVLVSSRALGSSWSGGFEYGQTWPNLRPGDRSAFGLAFLAGLGAGVMFVLGTYQQAAHYAPVDLLLLLVAAVLLATLAAIAVFEPWTGLLLWIVAMPAINMARAQIFLGTVQIIPSTVLLLAIAGGLLLRLRSTRGALSGSRAVYISLAFAATIASLATVATALSRDPVLGAPIVLHGLLEPVAAAALVVSLRPNAGQIRLLAAAMGASVVLATVINVVRMLTIVRSFEDFEALRVNLARMTYSNVGIFGDMLVMALPLLIVLLLRLLPRGRWSRVFVFDALALSLAAIFLTYSKSAWIAAAVLLLVSAVVLTRRWRTRIPAVAAVALAVAVFIPYPQMILEAVGMDSPVSTAIAADVSGRAGSFDPNSPAGEVSITERYLATKAGLQMSIDHPLIGVGPGRFGIEYGGPYRDPTATRVLGSAHDLIPELAAEFGLPLAGAFIVACLLALAAAFRVWRSASDLRQPLALAFGMSLLGFLIVATLFGVDLYRPSRVMNSDVLYAGLLLGAIAALAALPGANSRRTRVPARMPAPERRPATSVLEVW
jgi:hypothetical protein